MNEPYNEAWAADYNYWRDLPLEQKTAAIEAAIHTCGSDEAAIYAAIRTTARYPFNHTGIPGSELRDVCIKGGRIKFPSGRLVDWGIWKVEHTLEIRAW